MTASQIGYWKVHRWVKQWLSGTHATVVVTVGWAILCLLVAQRVTPAALARAIPAEADGSARSRLRRVRRWWQGPELNLGRLTPHLIRVALALLPAEAVVIVAMDTTRIGRWEVWQVGVVFQGHTLPIAWAVIPYPWPKGRFRETTLGLVRQVQAAFPPGHRWVFVADRGFPSPALFAQLLQGKTGWTVRLRLSDWVEISGVYGRVREHLEAGRIVPRQRVEATLGRGTPDQPRVAAWVVASDVVPLPPRHKRNPGTERERAARAKGRAEHLAHKGRKRPSAAAQRYAQTWVLCTTTESVAEAVEQYAARMAVEQTFRDWHHGWGLRAAADLPTEAMVCRLVGIVSLAYWLQVLIGRRVSQDILAQRRCAQWTVSGRVSLFWRGQHVFQDPGYDWSGWLAVQLDGLLMPSAITSMTAKQAA